MRTIAYRVIPSGLNGWFGFEWELKWGVRTYLNLFEWWESFGTRLRFILNDTILSDQVFFSSNEAFLTDESFPKTTLFVTVWIFIPKIEVTLFFGKEFKIRTQRVLFGTYFLASQKNPAQKVIFVVVRTQPLFCFNELQS